MSKEEEKLAEKPIEAQTKEMSYLERSLFGVFFSKLHTIIPGLVVVILLALLSMWLSDLIGKDLMGFEKSPISAVMICLILGLVISSFRNVSN